MSSQTSGTTYSISAYSSDSNVSFNFNLPEAGITDSQVIALIDGIKALPWPAAIGTMAVQANKTAYTSASYNYNAAATPPAFN